MLWARTSAWMALVLLLQSAHAQAPPAAGGKVDVLAPDNLVAWCIVPFDAKKRGPAERAEMLVELGLRRCAYDWREEHVATFEQEILEYQKRGIEFFAFWDAHPKAFELFKKYKLHPQVWRTAPSPEGASVAVRIAAAAESLRELCQTTRELGCPLGLYNHGGWGGEPKNLVAVCQHLREQGFDHVGIVYNWHHGHDHIADWAESLRLMQPYLLCLNLNGMNEGANPKILGLGKGRHERDMLRAVLDAGYQGPVGVIGHQAERDAREALDENLQGLARLRKELDEMCRAQGAPAGDARVPGGAADATQLAREAVGRGDARRGAHLFADARSACLSCHKVAGHGGAVGPDLSQVGKERTAEELAWSLCVPQRDVKPEFVVWKVVTDDGRMLTGYRGECDDATVRLRDPALGTVVEVARASIEEELPAGSLMPEGLLDRLSQDQRLDLVCFLASLGKGDVEFDAYAAKIVATPQVHSPVTFPYTREPLDPSDHPNWQLPINRDRVYDFYAKQAEHFRRQRELPVLLGEAPELDGGKFGHWGNQDEQVWADDRWNATDLGTLQCGIFHAGNLTVPRGICVRLGDNGELAACFNPDTLRYEAAWSGGFVKFSSVRHGFLAGLERVGTPQPLPEQPAPTEPFVYRGFYRHGKRVVFSYAIGGVEYLDAPWVEDGKFTRLVAPAAEHPLRALLDTAPRQWPQTIKSVIHPGDGKPYAIDTIELPFENPWRALVFCGGHDFLSDGSAVVGTMQGDVWRVEGLDGPPDRPGTARWRRIAAGLHHVLGVVVVDDVIYALGRDQITRLHDKGGDGEVVYYECFSKAYETSPAGHDFICGLERDARGDFYTASGNQGLLRVAANGATAEVLATGFRNPDGLCVLPDGTITVPCSEGEWTASSMICAFRPSDSTGAPPVHFGYGGPRDGKPPALPLAYLPRGLDNSSGGQVVVTSDRWGPLRDQLIHFSFGAGTHFLVLRDEVRGQMQGAVVPLAGDFRSGVHRGRFSPRDGQLYVTGMAGWGTYTPDDGCFQRVRYVGEAAQLPVGFHVHENGVAIRFSEPLDAAIAGRAESHFAQCWNYRYSSAYGSPEYSTTHPGVRGHDPLAIASAHVLENGRTLFLELPELQPVNQLHLRLHVDAGRGHDVFATVHALDQPFTDFPGYRPRTRPIGVHPLLADLARSAERVPNPHDKPIHGVRQLELATGKNLTFAARELRAVAGEALEFTLVNPDVVPHNWALVKPGSLTRVGQLANHLVADPDAAGRQYIPQSDDVLAYTDVVPPGGRFTIYFHAPRQPGRYPFLCTFPGHWMVMNGELVVEPKSSG